MREPVYHKPEIAGDLFGFDVEFREPITIGDKRVALGALLTLCIEDDDFWHRKPQVAFDEAWLNDMIRTCERAKEYLKSEHMRRNNQTNPSEN